MFLRPGLVRSAAAVVVVGVMGVAALPAFGDSHLFRRHKKDCQPPCPVIVETRPAAPAKPEPIPTKPQAKPEMKPEPAPVLTDERFAALATATVALAATPNMLGDFIGANTCNFRVSGVDTSQLRSSSCIFEPSFTRVFKIADNENPRPQDRVYVSYNYFDPINQDLNLRLLGPGFSITDLHRYTVGFEKTLLDGQASIGMRLPMTTVETERFDPGFLPFFPPSTAGDEESEMGDVAVILKLALWQDRPSDSLVSAGLLFTLPTGPDSFDPTGNPIGGGFGERGERYHSNSFQPFIGYVLGMGDWFIHGFSSVDIPSHTQDATLMLNDVGVGYWLYRGNGGLLSAIVPTVEVHVTTPLSHKDPLQNIRDFEAGLDNLDPSSMPDLVTLTYGTTLILGDQVTLAFGLTHPITGPQPFDLEFQLHLNVFFGGPASPVAPAPRPGLF